jgi:hypothetical protein
MVLVVVGIGVLAWAVQKSAEPPAPSSKSESPAERAQRLAKHLRAFYPDRLNEAAAKELGEMGPEASAAVPKLIELLWDESWRVRKEASETLDRIDKDWPKRDEASAAVPHLIPFLWHQDKEVREAAAQTLDRIDKDWPRREEARAAIPQLIKVLGDKGNWKDVLQAATETLDRIDKDWPKRDEAKRAVADILDLFGAPISDYEEVGQTLDRIDGKWRESDKAKAVVLKLIRERYKSSDRWDIPHTLDYMDRNWKESPEAKKAISELIDELTAEASRFGYVSPPEGELSESAVEKAAIRALVDKLDTRSRAEFETTVAVLDSLDKDWPVYKEAKPVATKLTARLTTWNPNPGKGAVPPILPETLDRMDPTWAQSDNARKAIPELVKRLSDRRDDDVVADAALLVRIDEESMEPVEERIIPRLADTRDDTGYEVVLAIKTLGRIGKAPAIVVPKLVKWPEGRYRGDFFSTERKDHQIALAAVEALGVDFPTNGGHPV